MRVLLLNLNSETNDLVNNALAGQGYDITTESGLTVDEVLALSAEVLVTEASPTDLSCCGMITQLKARSDTRTSVKILMVVRGGALERARALDLGADDVITFPFEAIEFAARVRTQFRERQPEEDLKTMLKYAVQREQMADIAVESLSGGAVNKHRYWLIPAIFVVSAGANLGAGFIVF
jgi:DNA-binding response OmpR family regulator